MMYIAMRGTDRIAEGDNLDQVVTTAEKYMRLGAGDVIVWQNNKRIVVEIEEQEDGEPFTMYKAGYL